MQIRNFLFCMAIAGVLGACSPQTLSEEHRAQKRMRDSLQLAAQERSLEYYRTLLEQLGEQADSILPLFTYEKNAKYQDHGYYIAKVKGASLRVMVRDDGEQPVLVYRNGKRIEPDYDKLSPADKLAMDNAWLLETTVSDIKETEKRFRQASMQVQKYKKRLQSK